MQTAAVISNTPERHLFTTYDHTAKSRDDHTTVGVPRTGLEASAGRAPGRDARAFLAQAELDEDLAEKLAQADGDMTCILAIAAEAGYACTAQELVNAYDGLARSGPNAAIYDFGHPIVYLNLRAPLDLGHAAG